MGKRLVRQLMAVLPAQPRGLGRTAPWFCDRKESEHVGAGGRDTQELLDVGGGKRS